MAPRKIELLAPAKNADIAIEAIRHGADAVYIGPESFGARAAAGNSTEEIARAAAFAHRFGAKVYATVNTIVYDSELSAVERLIRQLYKAGVDALIVQDMGILRMDIPPIELHASTQCDTRTVEKAKFLEAVGFSQIVLARELSLNEISDIHKEVSVPLESFIHGALCVSYSGRCHASYAFRGRSANRGECAQLCRLPYNLTDAAGNVIVEGKHLLSLRDFNQSDRLADLLKAGASSLKIEGRLKEAPYVKNVTAYYSRLLNQLCEAHPDLYCRASAGSVQLGFEPDLSKSFNRGFTHYFADGRGKAGKMVSLHTPKSLGEVLGKVVAVKGRDIVIDSRKPVANGDGLAYFNNRQELVGFRANKAEGRNITPLSKLNITPGTLVYRNLDKAFTDRLEKESAERRLKVDICMWQTAAGVALTVTDERGISATTQTVIEHQPAKSPQTETRRKVFSKLGNTVYELKSLDCGDTEHLFIPSSLLADMRRNAIDALERVSRINYRPGRRRTEDTTAVFPYEQLTFADNVANRYAADFYRSHGVKDMQPAAEAAGKVDERETVMTTRYCLRRELDCCLKTKNAHRLPSRLILASGDIHMEVEFDCKNCQMKLHKL